MKTMKIGIHITTYNRLEFTKRCISSLFWSNPKNCELVIVDNNSDDGTIEYLTNLKHPMKKAIILNNQNMFLGYSVFQGWNELKDTCDILGWINNDFLFEPGWDENLVSCFNELNIDYIDGITNITNKQKKPISEIKRTFSGKGKYVLTENVGAAYFILKSLFKEGIYPSKDPWREGYSGPGPLFLESMLKKDLRGVRLSSPGILILDPEYTNEKNTSYYEKTFLIRGITELLEKYKNKELENGTSQGIKWNDFLLKYYPDKIGDINI